MSPASKMCSGCGQLKLLADYYAHSSSKSGVASRCKACTKTRYLTPTLPKSPVKRCSGCGRFKILADYPRDRSKKDGLHYTCRACSTAKHKKLRQDPVWRARAIAISAEYRRTHPKEYRAGIRNSTLRAKYGIDSAGFERMAAAQDRKCKICSVELVFTGLNQKARAVVDHCHNTGRVRGVLCHRCNLGLGCFNDSPVLLQLAKEYLT
jgi:hypothetical protein